MPRTFPIIVLVFPEGRDRKVIRSAREAAQLFLKEWPIEDGEEFFTAVRTCLQVLTGEIEPELLHEAIIRAAYEAGIAAITTDQRLGILRIYPVEAVCARAPLDPDLGEPPGLSPPGRRRRQRHWSGRSSPASIGNTLGRAKQRQNCASLSTQQPD